MNQDLAQTLTNTDALINSLNLNPTIPASSQVDEIKKLRVQMESKINSYNSVITKANEEIRKDLDELSREIQQKINYLMQPKQ